MIKILLTAVLFFVCSTSSFAQTINYPLQTGDGDTVSALSWSPRNDLILTSSGDDNGLRLWHVTSGKAIWKTDVGFLQDDLEYYWIRIVVWTKDQKFILTGTDNGKIQCWEAATGKLIWNIKAHADRVTAISINPNARMFVSSAGESKSELKVWSFADGKIIKDLSANQKAIEAIRFINDNSFQTGDGNGRIKTYSTSGFSVVSTKQNMPCGSIKKRNSNVTYSPNFTFLAAQCQNSLVITNVSTRIVLRRIAKKETNHAPSFSQDEKSLFLPDAQVLDIYSGKTKQFEGFDSGVLNNDGSLIATLPSYRADGVQIFDTETGVRQGWLVGHPGSIKSLAFSHDGSRFASGSADGIVRVWDTQSKKILLALEGHTRTVESIAFSDNGLTLTSRSKKETILWSCGSGRMIQKINEENSFDNDGNKTFSASGRFALIEEYDKPFRLVNAETNETIKEFILIDQLDNLVFCPDERYFLAKPWWSGWQLWSVETGKPLREFNVGYSFYDRVAFHPDGKTFITGGEGQNVFMFDLASGETIWSLFPVDEQEFASQKASEARRVA